METNTTKPVRNKNTGSYSYRGFTFSESGNRYAKYVIDNPNYSRENNTWSHKYADSINDCVRIINSLI